MRFPLTIAYRGIAKDSNLHSLIENEAENLERLSDRIRTCRVVVEALPGTLISGEHHHITLGIVVQNSTELIIQHEASLRGFFRRRGVSNRTRNPEAERKRLERAVKMAFSDARHLMHDYERTLMAGRNSSPCLSSLDGEIRRSA